jgi:carboxyl-terminal processing protease
MPLVVLVNGNSASAAEIIAGALQDHDRALVVGTTTFGKGLVQSVVELAPGPQALKLTTGRWFTPSGRQLERPVRRGAVPMAAVDDDAAEDTTATDSTRPKFYTDGGRVVLGGGGITPDRVVRSDSLSTGEQAFARALGARIPEYRASLSAYALAVKGRNGVSSPDFAITTAMRRGVIAQMRERGIDLPDSVFAGATDLLDQQLGDEITRYVFGRPAEIRRQVARDPQVRAATAVLTRARTPAELFALAEADTGRGR